MDWVEDRWHDLTELGSPTWLAVAAWLAVALGIAALFYAHRQIQRSRQLDVDQIRPQVVMYMESHPADWHLIELVIRNFGKTAAYDIQFAFFKPPTVARYEEPMNSIRPEIVELLLPEELPSLAPNQEWRTVWDSAKNREQLGEAIESRFDGTLTYYDSADDGGKRARKRHRYQSKVVLDWETLPPVDRIETLTGHDLAKRERQKLELLRSLLTYYEQATKETRPDVLRGEIERMNRAAAETQIRVRTRDLEQTTRLEVPWADANPGRHHG